MTPKRQPSVDWDSLILSIHEGDCILMIGPDAVTEPDDGTEAAIMRLFGRELCRDLNACEAYGALTVPQVAQIYRDQKGPVGLLAAARSFFMSRRGRTTEPLQRLAKLPFKVVIDATPLNQMESAFLLAHKNATEDWYHKRESSRPLGDFSVERPLVYHIFGSTGSLKSLVLAENDLIDLLVSICSGNPKLPDNLVTAISKDYSCMLFLGFGVRHLSLRVLLHVLSGQKGSEGKHSFALEVFEDVDRRAADGAKLFFKQRRQIDYVDMELGEFTAQLLEKYEAFARGRAGQPEPAIKLSQAPIVFLSYCREDGAQAARVRTGLEARGIRVWMDSSEILAGQDWDTQIKAAIEKVDFFLVLNSATLLGTYEGYVNTELKLALARGTSIMGAFVCPLKIDESDLRGDLKHSHAIPVTSDDGLDQLANHLERNLQIKKKVTNR